MRVSCSEPLVSLSEAARVRVWMRSLSWLMSLEGGGGGGGVVEDAYA